MIKKPKLYFISSNYLSELIRNKMANLKRKISLS